VHGGFATPKFEKSPPALVARFEAVAQRDPAARLRGCAAARLRSMSGYPALFVGGNHAAGQFAERWVVRMAQADLDALLDLPGAARFSPMPGCSMTG